MFAPVHPGRIIKDDYLEPLELTTVALAEALGVTRQAISAIINERAGVSPEMAIRLSRAFDTTADLWLVMQKNYDLAEAKKTFVPEKKIKQLYTAA